MLETDIDIWQINEIRLERAQIIGTLERENNIFYVFQKREGQMLPLLMATTFQEAPER